MKKLFLAALAATVCLFAFGAEISEAQAVQAVRGWMNLEQMLQDRFSAEPESVKRYEGKDGKGAFYVVSLKGGGVVVTSGDTALAPVVAYSADGVWVDDPAKNPCLAMLPIDIAAATDAAEAGTGRAGAGAAASGGKQSQWDALLAAGASGGRAGAGAATSSAPADLRVGKLLTTAWDQDVDAAYNKTWNLYTPLNRVCGCIATATGQIMAYYKWPKGTVTAGYPYEYSAGVDGVGGWHVDKGYQASAAQKEAGEYTAWAVPFGGIYDWDTMLKTETHWWHGTVPTAAARQEMGRLVRDVGIASYMLYGSSGSGTFWHLAHSALLETFQYANAIIHISKSGLAETVWKPTILSNLDAKLPVGVGVPGHAIVADGYGYDGSGNLYIHFNMGWSGRENYWYNPPDLTASGQSGFTSIDDLLYNIYPENPNGSGSANLTIVSGRILGSAGSVLAGQTVTAKRSGATYTETTDSKGIFAFKLPGGYTYTISASKDNVIASASVAVKACASGKYNSHSHNGTFYPAATGTASNVHGLELTVNQLQTPEITPATGTQFREGSQFAVSFTCATQGVTFRYTTDGSEPTEESASGATATITSSATVKVKAFKSGYVASETASATFTALPDAPQPSLTPLSGTTIYGPRRRVTIACAVAGATIRYTLDGSEPTEESALYTGPFLASVPATVKAKAWADGCWPAGSPTAVVVLEKTEYSGGRWIDETEATQEATGEWAEYVEYTGGAVEFDESTNMFTPSTPAGGAVATIEAEMTFNGYGCGAGNGYAEAKTALCVGDDGGFEVYCAGEDGKPCWKAVSADGVPVSFNTQYRVRIVLDCRRKTFTAAICPADSEGEPVALADAGGARTFKFANPGTGMVKDVSFAGSGKVFSIHGDCSGPADLRSKLIIFVE